MQLRANSCSPETLGRLQNIFDAVWLELEQQRSRHTFPWAVEAARFTVARLVLAHVNDLHNLEQIKQDVLKGVENSL